jgi:hypothetical protein
VDYFRLFYEYIEEKVSDFLFVKSGSVIIFFESSHDSSYKCLFLIICPNYFTCNCNLIHIYTHKIRTYFKIEHTRTDTPKLLIYFDIKIFEFQMNIAFMID